MWASKIWFEQISIGRKEQPPMLKRRVTESTLDTYAARVRPADLAVSAFRGPASRPAEAKAAGQRPESPERPQQDLLNR